MLQGLLKKLGRFAIWCACALLSAGVLLVLANRLLDESPDPARDRFLTSDRDQASDSDNIAVGIAGLTAPRGENFMAQGAKLRAAQEQQVSWAELQDLRYGAKSLKLTVSAENVNCWLDPGDPTLRKMYAKCLPFEEAPRVLQENGELVSRYKALYALEAYSNRHSAENNVFLTMPKLVAAQIHLDLRAQKYEDALKEWNDQFRLLRRYLRGSDTWVGKIVGMVAMGFAFDSLESILGAKPELVLTHTDELLQTLKPAGIAGFNIPGMLRTEYRSIKDSLAQPPADTPGWGIDRLLWFASYAGQKERILNRYYRFAVDYQQALLLPVSELDAGLEKTRSAHAQASGWDWALDPIGTMFMDYFVEAQLKLRTLVRQMHYNDAKLRLGTLAVRIINEKVSDADIPQFLSTVEPELYDPFSGEPMKWNGLERRIYFPDPDNKCHMWGSFRIPSRETQTASGNPSNRQAC